MASVIIDFSNEEELKIKAYKNWKLGKSSKARTVRAMVNNTKIPEKYYNEEE